MQRTQSKLPKCHNMLTGDKHSDPTDPGVGYALSYSLNIVSMLTIYISQHQLMSAGLQRAREPFRFRNAFTGLGLGLLAFGIYSYSISAVKQDAFDDIDEEVKALARTGTTSGAAALSSDSSSTPSGAAKPPPAVLSKDEEQRIMESAFAAATGTGGSSTTASRQENGSAPIPTLGSSQRPARGLLQGLDRKLPWLLDPQNKTLVWGAPPVDDLGKTSSSRRS